ncbi:MAG TPA: SDR family NAD(P)-dependent oxidoreductase [Acidimicrobiales bacterium]|nr:SDR family NAD(P)-dependent oxidoreductase [Acidimicrobiales bacterium]
MASPGPARPVAVVTGASSGIGAATVRQLVDTGWDVVAGARRTDRLEALAAEVGGAVTTAALDVADTASVEALAAGVPACRLLVNNAGGALGLQPVAEFDEDHWRTMYETNVLGVARMTRALLPKLLASGNGHVITIGSVAGFEPYAGGGGYNAAKAGAAALGDVLRIELNGQPIRVSEIDPGMVETDFSLTRFAGDAERAAAVYRGVTPLSADDVAEAVAWVASRPSHVDVDRLVIRPRDQARVYLVHRDS